MYQLVQNFWDTTASLHTMLPLDMGAPDKNSGRTNIEWKEGRKEERKKSHVEVAAPPKKVEGGFVAVTVQSIEKVKMIG